MTTQNNNKRFPYIREAGYRFSMRIKYVIYRLRYFLFQIKYYMAEFTVNHMPCWPCGKDSANNFLNKNKKVDIDEYINSSDFTNDATASEMVDHYIETIKNISIHTSEDENDDSDNSDSHKSTHSDELVVISTEDDIIADTKNSKGREEFLTINIKDIERELSSSSKTSKSIEVNGPAENSENGVEIDV